MGPLGLGSRQGPERPARAVALVPGRLGLVRGGVHSPLDLVVQGAVGVAVEALAIDAHGGGDDEAPHRLRDQRLQEDGGAAVVHVDIAVDGIHALPDPDLGGQVDHPVDAVERRVHRRPVADVADPDVDLAGPKGQGGRRIRAPGRSGRRAPGPRRRGRAGPGPGADR